MKLNGISGNITSLAAIVISIVAIVYSMGNRSHVGHPTVAFVDFQAVLQQSDAGKSIHDQVEPRRLKLQESAEVKLKELKQQQEAMKQQGSKSPEGTAALQKQIEEWNTEAQKRQAALNEAVNPAVKTLETALRQQLEIIAEENKFTAILPLQNSFYAEKALDLTPEAIRRLNSKLPKVDIKFEDEKSK